MAGLVRWLLLLLVFCLPLLYDAGVLEVAGDIRASAIHVISGMGAILLLIQASAANRRIRLVWPPMTGLLGFLLLLSAGTSLFHGIVPLSGLEPLKLWLALFALAVVTASVWNDRLAHQLMWAAALPILFLAALGTAQYFRWTASDIESVTPSWLHWTATAMQALLNYYEQTVPPGTTFANRALTASWIATVTPLLLALILVGRTIAGRALAMILLVCAFTLLVFCVARAAWVAVAVALMAFLAAYYRPRIGKPALLIGIAAAIGFGASIVLLSNGRSIVEIVDDIPVVNMFLQREYMPRVAYNLNGLAMVLDHPWMGVGLGNFYQAYPLYHAAWVPSPLEAYDVVARPQNAHNDILQTFIELGIPGGLLLLGVLGCAIHYAIRIASVSENPRRLRTLLFGCALVALGVNSLLDFPLRYPTAPGLAAILIGGITAEYRSIFSRGLIARQPLRSRWLALSLLLITAAAWLFVLHQDLTMRQGHILVKQAIVQIARRSADETALKLVERARELHRADPRIHQYVGVAYATAGGATVQIDDRIRAIEAAVAFDPHGPYLLVQLANRYLAIAGFSPPPSKIDPKIAQARAEEIYARLLRVAGFSHFTDVIGGSVALLRGDLCTSERLYQRALKRFPGEPTANTGLATIEQYRRIDSKARAEICPAPEALKK
jgi:O-antigen ligase